MKLVLILAALISAIYAQDSSEYSPCVIEGVNVEDDYDYGYAEIEHSVPDDHKGPLLTFPKGTITDVEWVYGEGIVASITEDQIVFEFSDKYRNYDFDFNTVTGDSVSMYGSFNFKCPEGETYLEIGQTVEDVNNHSPIFNRKKYTYKFGNEVAAGFDLTQLVEIFAVDLDFTDKSITFTISKNEYLEIKESGSGDSYKEKAKTHYAKLVTKKQLVGSIMETYKITATDKGGKKGEAEVTLIIESSK